jgi:hypothetical protein
MALRPVFESWSLQTKYYIGKEFIIEYNILIKLIILIFGVFSFFWFEELTLKFFQAFYIHPV